MKANAGQIITAAAITAARSWLEECADCGLWEGFGAEDAAELTDAEVMRAITRYYDGGIEAFVTDCVGY